MKIKIKNSDKCNKIFEVEIPPETVKSILKDVYKDIKSKARIPGYRVGNAPQDLLEKYHGKTAEQEVLNKLVPEGYRNAIGQYKIKPVSLPEFFGVKLGDDKRLKFKAKVEVRPEIKLKNYKGIRVKRKKVEVSPEEAGEAMKRIQEMNAQFTPLASARVIKKGDYTICDIEALIDGKPISKNHNNMWLIADKDASMLGVGEHLIGAMSGETKEVDVLLPKDYPDKKFAGKNAKFKIHIKEIKEKKVPPLDDALAKDIGLESIKKLEENLSRQLLERKEAGELINVKNQILDKLLKDYKFDVPSSMVKRQFDVLLKQTEEELLRRGIHKESVSDKLRELRPKLKIDAASKIKIYFLLDDISNAEGIKVSEEDFTEKFESIARMSNQHIDSVRGYYKKNDLMGGLEEQLKEEKTLDWLVSVSNIEEVPPTP